MELWGNDYSQTYGTYTFDLNMTVWYPPNSTVTLYNPFSDPGPKLVNPLPNMGAVNLAENNLTTLVLPGVARFKDKNDNEVFTTFGKFIPGTAFEIVNFTKGEDIYKSVGTLQFYNKDPNKIGKFFRIIINLKGSHGINTDLVIVIFPEKGIEQENKKV